MLSVFFRGKVMPTEATVTNLDDERLIREGEAAVDLYNKDLRNARARIMPMARGLLAAKRKYPATQDFGDWLQTSSYREIEKNDRAALLNIGEHDDFAARYIRTTVLTSPQTIWAAIRELMPSYYDSNSTSGENSTPKSPPAITNAPKSDKPREPKQPSKTPKPITSKTGFYEAPRAQEIAAKFTNKEARVDLSRIWKDRNGKQIWELIATALDGGLLVETARTNIAPTLQLLFPLAPTGYARRFDLTKLPQRKQVKDQILPAMIACRDKLLAEPDRMREIMAEYEQERITQQREVVVEQRRSTAVAAMPPTEQELMMFGQTVWPRLDIRQGDYDYDQVRAAIWTFRDYESWNQMAKEDTGSHALRIRNSLRYLGEYLQRTDRNNPTAKIFSLIIWFSRLMEKNPKGECKWPMYPHVEGQW
jgi:hypothetical protein